MANKSIEIENNAMKEILIAMHSLGGQVTRKEIMQELRENSDVFSEEQIDQVRKSKKTGTIYHPFQWKFNFAVKHLILADFINDIGNYHLELSKKGRNVDLATFDPNNDVRSISESKMPHQAKAPKNQVVAEKEGITSLSETLSDDIEEPWRQQLLKSLEKMNPKKFELFCRGLLKKMGIDVDENIGVQYVADGGLDGFGYGSVR